MTRLINSTEIQSIVRSAGQKVQKRPWTQKKNPLVNKAVLFRLNPYAKTIRRQELRMSFLLTWCRDFSMIISQAGAYQETRCQKAQEAHCRRRDLFDYPYCPVNASSKKFVLANGRNSMSMHVVDMMLNPYAAMLQSIHFVMRILFRVIVG